MSAKARKPRVAARRTKPNILFLFTDDQRFDTIRALGNPHIQTPTIDSLVREGVTFANAYIMGGTSAAVCMPSRAMLHSGRTLFHIGGVGENIPIEHVTLGEHLRANGYCCWTTGKWHNGAAAFARSFSSATDIFFGGMQDHWNVPVHDFDPTGEYKGRLPICENPWYSNKVYDRPGDHVHAGKHSSEVFGEAAVDFLDHYSGDDPFFMYVSFMAPHDPRTMPKRYLEMYDPETIPTPENFLPEHPFDNGELKGRDEMLVGRPRTPAVIRRQLADYYAMITHADAQMALIIDKLKATGRYENTIILFSGDNGLALGRHGLMGKQSVYDHSVHVPLIFAGPGIPKGERRDAFCYLHDVYPTLCGLAGLPIPDTVEGMSLVPAIQGAVWKTRDVLLFAYCGLHRAAMDERWKLIEYVVNGQRTTQFFDFKNDPFEMRNLADDPACAVHLTRLRAHLLRWRDELGDSCDEFWKCRDR